MQFIIKTMGVFIVIAITWITVVNITGGVIKERYGLIKGVFDDSILLDLTGRAQIYKIDLDIFSDYLLTGSGPGQASKLRSVYGYGKEVSAHTEFSRMLAEHGILGLMALSILIGIPFRYFFSFEGKNNKVIKILFGVLAMLTMFHSAMRIAMPCFIYGFLIPQYED